MRIRIVTEGESSDSHETTVNAPANTVTPP
jgi:hypothetical protein